LTIGTPVLGPTPSENLDETRMLWGFGTVARDFSDFNK
jgi:hypothetical protein